MMLRLFTLISFLFASTMVSGQNIYVLGIAQDGGYPHAGCAKDCCKPAWDSESVRKHVVALAITDTSARKWWLVEATPDISWQLYYFRTLTGGRFPYLPEGILLTHAHIGHYAGLMQLGREVMNTKEVAVYAMPRMKDYLEHNGPWSQLVKLNNIRLMSLAADSAIRLTDHITVTPVIVPHRDEYSETVGYRINAGHKVLFIPDINKWNKWDRSIVKEVADVDIALLDATFCDGKELPSLRIEEVPHPFVSETMSLFGSQPASVKSHVWFIHCNHTNPLIWDTARQQAVKKAGFNIAYEGQQL